MTEVQAGLPQLTDLSTYLELSGWRFHDQDANSTEWLRVTDEHIPEIRVVLPTSEQVADYEQLVEAAVRTIAYQEQRPVRDVFEDIALGGADIVAFRLTPNAPSGEAPLR